MNRNTRALKLSAVVVAGLMMMSPLAYAGRDVPEGQSHFVITLTGQSRFVINSDEVYDKNTDLTWQRCSEGRQVKEDDAPRCIGEVKLFTFDQAQQLGHGQWRVPSKDELASLYLRYGQMRIDRRIAFPDYENLEWYWTSTPEGASGGWSVHFNGGSVDYGGRCATLAVRLVRSGR